MFVRGVESHAGTGSGVRSLKFNELEFCRNDCFQIRKIMSIYV